MHNTFKNALLGFLLGVVGLGIVACGNKEASTPAAEAAKPAATAAAVEEEKILNIYNWSDYIAPDTIANFEKETGIKVRYDIFDSNEILHAKLMAKSTGYDIVVPSSNWAKLQIDGGLFQKLDRSKLPNWKNLDTNVLKLMEQVDPGNQYLVDWMWSFNTVGINEDKVKAALGDMPMPDNAWDLVFDPKYTSKLKSCGIVFLDTPTDVFQAALHYLGKPVVGVTEDDYKAAYDMLMKVRPDIKKFTSGGQIDDIAAGNICVAYGWAGDMSLARNRSKENGAALNIKALVPKNGGLMFMDTMAIPADAKHPNNAHLFLNYIMEPKVIAACTNTTTYRNGNRAATEFVDPEIKNNPAIYMTDEEVAKLVPPSVEDSKSKRIVTRLYTQFKTGT